MPTITSNSPIEQFVFPGWDEVRSSKTEVAFGSEREWENDYGFGNDSTWVKYEGQFSSAGGVTYGTITSITFRIYHYDNHYDSSVNEWAETYKLKAEGGIYIDDLYKLQQSGKFVGQLLLAGDDDIYGPIYQGYGGNDIFHDRGTTTIDGGSGFDTFKFDLAKASVRLDLVTDPTVYVSIERFIGSKYADQMRGDEGSDYFRGDRGNDLLIGRWGDDRLLGDAGNDTLIGGPGRDILSGGAGRDVFVFEKVSESVWRGYDTISDFNRADDLIDLHKIDANSNRGGNQEFKFIGNHAFTGHAGELRYFNPTSGGTHIVADVNGDKVVDFDVFLRYTRHLTAADFDL